MIYECAPMEGVTGDLFRQAQRLHFTPADLFQARHVNELTPRKETYLSLDIMQRGLGTATCGEDTRYQYRLHSGVHCLSVKLVPFLVGDDLARVARFARQL